MNRFAIATPEGTRDRLVAGCCQLRKTEGCVRDVLERRGYREIVTPALEYYDVFLQAASPLDQEAMFKLTDRSGRLLVMRPDSTTPIARIAATKLSRERLPQHLYYVQNVYRADAGNGHMAETAQAGAELLGADGILADLDIITAAIDVMNTAAGAYCIELGHAEIYKALISQLGAPAETAETIRRLIETKAFASLGDVLEPYQDNEAYGALKAMPTLFGGAEVLQEVEKLTQNPKVLDAVCYLERIYTALKNAGRGDNVMIDLGLVHEMDYYTGIMFRGYLGRAGGTVVSGGRYDGLCARFGRQIPAVGFAVDLDGLAQPAQALGTKGGTLVFCTPDTVGRALEVIDASQGQAELSYCGSLEASLAFARENGYQTVLDVSVQGEAEVYQMGEAQE